jgi:hypothetical protein
VSSIWSSTLVIGMIVELRFDECLEACVTPAQEIVATQLFEDRANLSVPRVVRAVPAAAMKPFDNSCRGVDEHPFHDLSAYRGARHSA